MTTETKATHTPTPWHCDPENYAEYVWGPNNEMVLQLRGHGAGLPKRANAEFIVLAANCFDELLGIARGYKAYLINCTDVACAQESEILTRIEAVIAKAEGRL